MINLFKEQLAMRRLRKRLHAYTLMDRAFFRSARESFAELARQRAGARTVVARDHDLRFRYATVALIAVISLTSGLSVFADKNDVSPESPLYNFKRLGEEVRVAVAPSEKKIELREEYVERRVKEIAILKPEAPQPEIMSMTLEAPTSDQVSLKRSAQSSPDPIASISDTEDDDKEREKRKKRVERLTKDFFKETEKLLDQTEKANIQKERKAQVCEKAISAAYQDISSSPSLRFAERVQDRCQEILED